METLNGRAYRLCNAMVADAGALGIAISTLGGGTRIIDCGVKASGSVEAGRRLAEICLGGLGSVTIEPSRLLEAEHEQVVVGPEPPLVACMASQYAGWRIKSDGYFAMGSGPMRAAACRESLFSAIGSCEKPEMVVGVLESSKLPPDNICIDIAAKCGISPNRLTLLVTRTSSVAGTVQIVARSVETAMHKLRELGFDLNRIEHALGWAPLPPLANDELAAIGRTNDAILYGGFAELLVRGDDTSLQEIGPKVPSSASRDYGRPFCEIFCRYNHDFYSIDPLLFSPARVRFYNLDTRNMFVYGHFDRAILAESFAEK